MRFISVSVYLLFFAKNSFELGCKSTKNFLFSNTFLEKNKKDKAEFNFVFFKILIFNYLCYCFLFGDVLQGFDEEVPERLHTLDEQGFVG